MELNKEQKPFAFIVKQALSEGKPLPIVYHEMNILMSNEWSDSEINLYKSVLASIWVMEQQDWEISNNRLWCPNIKYVNPNYYE